MHRTSKSKQRKMSDTEQLEHYMHGNMASIKKFQNRVTQLNSRIVNAEDILPRLKQQVEALERDLPEWKERLRITQLSLTGHNKTLSNQYGRLDKLKAIEKLKKQRADVTKKITERTLNESQ